MDWFSNRNLQATPKPDAPPPGRKCVSLLMQRIRSLEHDGNAKPYRALEPVMNF